MLNPIPHFGHLGIPDYIRPNSPTCRPCMLNRFSRLGFAAIFFSIRANSFSVQPFPFSNVNSRGSAGLYKAVANHFRLVVQCWAGARAISLASPQPAPTTAVYSRAVYRFLRSGRLYPFIFVHVDILGLLSTWYFWTFCIFSQLWLSLLASANPSRAAPITGYFGASSSA